MNVQNKSILVVEDDAKIRKLIRIFLEKEGYEVFEAEDGEEGKRLFKECDPCFAILDLMLPKIQGEELCTWIREEEKSDIGIIMVTAKTSEFDRITGLKTGADDYVTKPFSPSELVTRVETVLRRTSDRCQKLSRNGLVLKAKKGEVSYKGNPIDLTGFEFRILHLLMKHPGQIISRQQILDNLYELHEKVVSERTIDVHIRHLRQKLQACTSMNFIETVRGMGYKFNG
ncbi:two-component system response regulator [[Bacillus] enclensis]|uniref:DNA-binding response regulator, OmpR family, contains REC and winged-helix (WHTH) domain n=1 Tax=[Bacillus] enclensis TaxID=1402860 RepID=A0A0V8HBD6_9BACI|nr:response regulator transcription factor [[Bacillus] enclensis]KSU59854.1 two-component system response regulator [[Bacillus] enclensis]SCC28045.1 DNA-binding response regulator, OmpR family, contains REC and winged-helix (wHTH) domain [[Bacillus] enclensis]